MEVLFQNFSVVFTSLTVTFGGRTICMRTSFMGTFCHSGANCMPRLPWFIVSGLIMLPTLVVTVNQIVFPAVNGVLEVYFYWLCRPVRSLQCGARTGQGLRQR